MILVDDRQGSSELVVPLQKLGLPVEETRLDSADLCFEGRGNAGASVLIGIEFKKLIELVQALRTERFQGHQLLKMRGADDPAQPPLYPFAYLLVEGERVYSREGLLQRRTGRHSFRTMPGRMSRHELGERLETLHLCGGLMPIWTETRADTLAEISIKYRWWTDRDLDAHTSHIAIYRPPSLMPISEFRVFLQSIDGLGFKASKAAETYFGHSLERAMTASISEWRKVEGIGPKMAQHIQDVWKGRVKR